MELPQRPVLVACRRMPRSLCSSVGRTCHSSTAVYAPQYGSAKDPINMVGFVAGGLLRGDHPQVDVEAIPATPESQQPFVLDVRTSQVFSAGSIPGAINIQVVELRSRLGELNLIERSPPIVRSGNGATWRPAFCGKKASLHRTSAAGIKRTSSFIRLKTESKEKGQP